MKNIYIASLIVIALSTQFGLTAPIENTYGDAACQVKLPYCKRWSSTDSYSYIHYRGVYFCAKTASVDGTSNGFSFAIKESQPYYVNPNENGAFDLSTVIQAAEVNVGSLEPFIPSDPTYYDWCTFVTPSATPTFDSTKVMFSCNKCSNDRTPVDGSITYRIVNGEDISALNKLPIGSLGKVSAVSAVSTCSASRFDIFRNALNILAIIVAVLIN